MAIFYQDAEPTTPAACDWWIAKSTGVFKIRNTGNTLWRNLGNLNRKWLGNLPLSGGTMNVAITFDSGAGVQTLTSGAFTGTATLDGQPISTKTAMQSSVDTAFAKGLTAASPNYTASSLFARLGQSPANYATNKVSLSLINYTDSDGKAIPSTKAQCSAVATPRLWQHAVGQSSTALDNSTTWDITEETSDSSLFRYTCTITVIRSGDPPSTSFGIEYSGMVAGRRA